LVVETLCAISASACGDAHEARLYSPFAVFEVPNVQLKTLGSGEAAPHSENPQRHGHNASMPDARVLSGAHA
jgi:hypothetical protein